MPRCHNLLADAFSIIPNLQHLTLDISWNELRINDEKLKYIGILLKHLPNLIYLNLNLEYNNLGEN